jgi:hypothetical protein
VGWFAVFIKTGVVMALGGVWCRILGIGRRLSGKPTFQASFIGTLKQRKVGKIKIYKNL